MMKKSPIKKDSPTKKDNSTIKKDNSIKIDSPIKIDNSIKKDNSIKIDSPIKIDDFIKDSPVKILIDLRHQENIKNRNRNNSLLDNHDLLPLNDNDNNSDPSLSINIERFDSEDRSDLELSFETSFDKVIEKNNINNIIDKDEILSLLSFTSNDKDINPMLDENHFDLHSVDVMDIDDLDKSDLSSMDNNGKDK